MEIITFNMKYKVLYDIDEYLLHQAANLHYEALSYRSFITLFGVKFLVELYKTVLIYQLGFFVFSFEDSDGNSKITGFTLGCFDSSKLLRSLLRRVFVFIEIILPVLIRQPNLMGKIVETVFYGKKIKSIDSKSELVVIVVEEAWRSKEVGKSLVAEMEREFIANGIKQYKVTVHDEMKKSNAFYLKNQMFKVESFMMYGTRWNIYAKNL